jgi:signal transduction histidine kinase
MTRLIDDLLDVSRIAQGKILLRKELFDIGALVRTVAADHRSLLEAGDLRLDLSLPGEPIWTAGDPIRISQVVGNLLQNAAKFTDPGRTGDRLSPRPPGTACSWRSGTRGSA